MVYMDIFPLISADNAPTAIGIRIEMIKALLFCSFIMQHTPRISICNPMKLQKRIEPAKIETHSYICGERKRKLLFMQCSFWYNQNNNKRKEDILNDGRYT